MPAAAHETAATLAGVVAAEAGDFPITQAEFARFCDFFYKRVGVQFTAGKRYFVDCRIAERARARTCATFRDYFAFVPGAGAAADVQQLIWSLPFSTGEEPYSFAISVRETWPHADQYDIEICGSDIDTRILSAAAADVYAERSLQNVGPQLQLRYFHPVDNRLTSAFVPRRLGECIVYHRPLEAS